jgi:pyruvate formate lyase activating enzyme
MPVLAAAAPQSAAAAPGPRALQVGGLTPFSTVDYPGQIAAVVFVQGCPWRCAYCHNPQLQCRDAVPAGVEGAIRWDDLRPWFARRVGLLDAVVFSGGEPTIDPGLAAAVDEVRSLGFRVGLHTAGMAPRRLQQLLPRLDWVGLDIKAPLARSDLHDRITGRRGGAPAVRQSLALLRASGVDFECRTTVHPLLLDDAALCALADELAAAGVRRWAVQQFRTTGCGSPLPPVGQGYPSPATLLRARGLIEHIEWRGPA